jgi:carboxylesterase
MDREKIAFAAMKPLDLAVGAAMTAVKATGALDTLGNSVYGVAKRVLGNVYEKQNQLRAEGQDHLPAQGGVLLASNHQSWNDVQVIAATATRRLHFLAKSEFERWPILRHLIALSDSPYIHRGGDAEGMAQATELLRRGKALVIFPEGTIPGEEDLMRHQVEPETGLLRGHTGAVRLAIAARVPVVPVGVSGTGASFPPEVYPRLELLHAPRPVPVTVRYGQPISYDEHFGKNLSREELRRLTQALMRSISTLVDHERGFVPITVPVPPLPRWQKLGVLLLHGFTSSVRTVDGMVPLLTAARIPYRLPVLRGHGTRYTDLAGVTADDWYADAEAALLDLAREVDRVVVVGLSMGGVVALNLGLRHPDKIAAVVTWAAALRFADPLAPLAPKLSRWVKSWPSPEAFNDESLKASSENYPRFMTAAFGELLAYARATEARLGELTVPICVLQSKKDQVVAPVAANIIYRDVASTHREIHWFEKSGHEMGQDLERQAVFETTMDYLRKLIA